MECLDNLLVDVRSNTHFHLSEREEESPKFFKKFCITMRELPLCEQARHPQLFSEYKIFHNAENVSEVFDLIRPYTEYPNYELLEWVVKKFGNPPLKEEMDSYVLQVEAFEKSTMINEFLAASVTTECYQIPDEYMVVIVEMKKEPSRCSVHEIRVFVKKKLTNKSRSKAFANFIKNVAVSSVLVYIGVPRQSLAQLCAAFDEQFKEEHCIVSVVLEGGEFQVVFCSNHNAKFQFQLMLSYIFTLEYFLQY